MHDAVVIGAGHNGLVAANRLADAGWDVIVGQARGSAAEVAVQHGRRGVRAEVGEHGRRVRPPEAVAAEVEARHHR